MKERGLSSTYRHSAHRVLSRALKVAVREGKAARNVCTLIDGPTQRKRKIRGYSLNHAGAIIRTALLDPLAARWLLGLLAGPRQGEVLGLRWPRVELDDDPHADIAAQLQRHSWEHGCTDPHACAAKHCRLKRCPPRYAHGCTDESTCKKLAHFCPNRRVVPAEYSTHRGVRGCPPPCTPKCTGHARACPERTGGGLVDVDLKTDESERPIPLNELLVQLLRTLREDQTRRKVFDPEGYVFLSETGGPIDPRQDHAAWEALLRRAGVPDGRLHAARHTAGSLLVATGMSLAAVQELFGHSNIHITKGYVEVAMGLKREGVQRALDALMSGDLKALLAGSQTGDRAVA